MAELRLTLRKHDDSHISKGAKNTIKDFFDQALIQYFLERLDEGLGDEIEDGNYHITATRLAPNNNRVLVTATLPAGPLVGAFNCNDFTQRANGGLNGGLLNEFLDGLMGYEVLNCAIEEADVEMVGGRRTCGGKRRSSKRRTSAKKTMTKKVSSKRRTNGGKRISSHRRRI
jgi:hypothetical protein